MTIIFYQRKQKRKQMKWKIVLPVIKQAKDGKQKHYLP